MLKALIKSLENKHWNPGTLFKTSWEKNRKKDENFFNAEYQI